MTPSGKVKVMSNKREIKPSNPPKRREKCPCQSGGVHCGPCLKPYACEPGMKHIYPSIEHPTPMPNLTPKETMSREKTLQSKLLKGGV